MTSSQRIRAKLVSRTNADCSEKIVKNNRYHYSLRFDESVGWHWLKHEVQEVNKDINTDVELYKITPSGVGDFEVEVRELSRREDIDDNQRGLSSFETES